MEIKEITGKTSIKNEFVDIYNSNNNNIKNAIDDIYGIYTNLNNHVVKVTNALNTIDKNTKFLNQQLEDLDNIKKDITEIKETIEQFNKLFDILEEKGLLS